MRTALSLAFVVIASSSSHAQELDAPAQLSEQVYEITSVLGSAPAMSVRAGSFYGDARGTCPVEPTLQNYVGNGNTSVPGFTTTEEVAAILNAPASHYPIEIVSIGIGWSSPAGNQPDSLESALKLYPAGLPNPGSAKFVAKGPLLVDGAINEFDISSLGGGRVMNGGPFTASLEILNASQIGGPAPVHDGAGCQPGKSTVKVNGVTWLDNCVLGVNGQWVVHVTYRRVECGITDCNGNGIHDPFEIAQGLAFDCNANGIPDDCDIAMGAPDLNMNGIPDECDVECVADFNGNGRIDAGDLAVLLAAWGQCP